MTKRNDTVSVLRAAAIILIVFHHTCCVMYEMWPPHGLQLPEANTIYHLSGVARAHGMNLFTLLSGFVLAYQYRKQQRYGAFLRKKVCRIVLPCLVAAALYWLLFPSQMKGFWPPAINGTHLWYLPMIFVCIILTSAQVFLRRGVFITLAGFALLYASAKTGGGD